MTRNMTLTRIKTFWQSTSGTALVEFVIVFPMMILFFAIMVEFGRLYWGYQSVVAGVRDAARYVGRVGP
ncbi:MAG: pilus assembly protein, partial [Maritimibacter sp.]|nr:pilus assembly protein [Maritimibacter sp.]